MLLVTLNRKESKMTTSNGGNNGEVIPPARGFDEFQTLSSTKQNIELFKILSAIAEEIEGLRQSTERRFSVLESLVSQNNKHLYGVIPSSTSNKSRSETSNR